MCGISDQAIAKYFGLQVSATDFTVGLLICVISIFVQPIELYLCYCTDCAHVVVLVLLGMSVIWCLSVLLWHL